MALSPSHALCIQHDTTMIGHQLVNMKSQFVLLALIVELLLVQSGAGVTYYVKPSQSSGQCPGHPCETFQYYLDNANTTLNHR